MIRWRRPAHDALFAVFVVGVLAYGAAFAWYMLGRFDLVNLLRDVNIDDAFYYFQIAYHLAGGEFSTVDGGITRTNGYHPLWLFLITPFYWVFDKTEALFAIKAFEIMLVAGGVALVAGAARVARLPWILLFAALPALYQIPAMLWGLEAAAALFLLGLFLLAVCLFARDPARWRWPLAAAAFALPWVRLEYVAISVAATAALCLVEWSGGFPSAPAGEASVEGPSPARSPAAGRMEGMGPALNAAAPLSGAVAGILAYFTWNAVVFGGLVPVSGATKRWLSQVLLERRGGYSLTKNVDVFIGNELLIALEICVYTAVVWWFTRRSRGRDDWLLLVFLVGVFGLAAGHLAMFLQMLTVHHRFAQYEWYFVPAYLMGALVVPVRCCVAVWSVRRFLGPELRRASGVPSLGIVVAGAVHLFAAADFAAPFRFVDRNREAVSRDTQTDSYMGTTVMNHLLPEGSVVITTSGSGIEGYFSRFPVVNGDGLVNSWDYLRAAREGNKAALVRRYGITHLVHYLHQPSPAGDDTLFQGLPHWEYGGNFREFRVQLASGSEGMGRDDRAAGFWERMKPHLERRADGGGLLVDGRLAQAFVPDCADALAEWTWAGQEKPAPTAWLRTSIGFCTSAIVLPPDARPPVRVATVAAGEYLAARVEGRRPAIDSDFDVYLVENRLVYWNESCGPEDVDEGFYLHVAPVDPDDVPPPWREGWDNLDFRFDDHRGLMFDGTCLVEVPLPAYRIAEIRTGHRLPGGWQGEVRFEPAEGQGSGP